jgi:hypothetical protein
MFSIGEILGQPDRNWTRSRPATESEIADLVRSVDFDWPAEYLDLLRFSNGGEGELALPAMWLQLYAASTVIEMGNEDFYQSEFPDHLFFASNGGVEMIAFDRSKKLIVMIDPISGPESAVEIAQNMDRFINAIGFEYNENA